MSPTAKSPVSSRPSRESKAQRFTWPSSKPTDRTYATRKAHMSILHDDDMAYGRASAQSHALPQKREDDMDLTPMVDVTFLLLIFFMITAAFALQKSIEVPPVQDDDAAPTQTVDDLEKDSIVVRIDGDNIFWIGAPRWDEEQKALSPQEMRKPSCEKPAEPTTSGPAKMLVQANGDDATPICRRSTRRWLRRRYGRNTPDELRGRRFRFVTQFQISALTKSATTLNNQPPCPSNTHPKHPPQITDPNHDDHRRLPRNPRTARPSSPRRSSSRCAPKSKRAIAASPPNRY